MARLCEIAVAGSGAGGGTQACTLALRGKRGLAPGMPAGTFAIPPGRRANGDWYPPIDLLGPKHLAIHWGWLLVTLGNFTVYVLLEQAAEVGFDG